MSDVSLQVCGFKIIRVNRIFLRLRLTVTVIQRKTKKKVWKFVHYIILFFTTCERRELFKTPSQTTQINIHVPRTVNTIPLPQYNADKRCQPCTCIYYSWSIQMSTWKVSVYGDCLPLSHLSHHRRLDSPAPKYNQSWCPDEHVGSIVYGDYPPPDALLALSQHRWQPVPPPPPPPPHTKYLSSNQSRCIARLAKSPSTRDNNALCVLVFTAQIDFCWL